MIPSRVLANTRLLLAGAHVPKELVFVRQRAHALRASDRPAKARVARSRNGIRYAVPAVVASVRMAC
jgi:hypothetical protein